MPIRFVYQSISWFYRVYRWNYAAYTASRLRRENANRQQGQANGHQEDTRQGRLFASDGTRRQNHKAKSPKGQRYNVKQIAKALAYWVYDRWDAIGKLLGNVIFPCVVCIATVTYCSISSRQLKQMKAQIGEMRTERTDNDKSTNSQLSILRTQSDTAEKQATALRDAADQAKIAAETAHDTLVASERAWVGPTVASLSTVPTLSGPVTLTVLYQNTGREPAIGVARDINANTLLPISEVKGETASDFLGARVAACKSMSPTPGGQVAFPTIGFNSLSLTLDLPKGLIDNSMQFSTRAWVISGCFAYITYSMPHHTAFCYYYEPAITAVEHLNICQGGNYAD